MTINSELIELALREDLALGDPTSALTVSSSTLGVGEIISKEELVFCGEQFLPEFFAKCQQFLSSRELTYQVLVVDGQTVPQGTKMAAVNGKAQDLLAIERTLLNFLQRLCGIATHTRKIVAKGKGQLKILDTRKTTPGWRALEKYSVRVGGASNHRSSLGDLILVKNNHIDLSGVPLPELLRQVFAAKPPYLGVEVEVRNIAELNAALMFRPTAVMLDNFTPTDLIRALEVIRAAAKGGASTPFIEVSGGVTADNIPEFEQLGIDGVSMGALTHQATSVDMSFRISKAE